MILHASRQRGSGLLEFSLALGLTAALAAAVLSVGSMLERRHRVQATHELIQRSVGVAKRQAAMLPNGFTGIDTGSLVDLVPANRVEWQAGQVAALRTPLDRSLRLAGNGPFAFWISVAGLDRSECRSLLSMSWRDHARIRVNQIQVKSQATTLLVPGSLAQCAGSGNLLDLEGT